MGSQDRVLDALREGKNAGGSINVCAADASEDVLPSPRMRRDVHFDTTMNAWLLFTGQSGSAKIVEITLTHDPETGFQIQSVSASRT